MRRFTNLRDSLAPRGAQSTKKEDEERLLAGAAPADATPESLQPRDLSINDILQNNREWADDVKRIDPEYFSNLAKQQSPEFLWIGCSDSRVPANQIMGLLPGEVFVHRNVANVVVASDLNCLSVLQFAVDVLKVRHVIVCGHYGCGGVKAALTDARYGLVDNWIRHVRDLHRRHTRRIAKCGDVDAQCNLLCELNVVQQLHNVMETTIVRDAWAAGSKLQIHGFVYSLADGVINPLITLDRNSDPYTMDFLAQRLIREAHRKAGVGSDGSDARSSK
jgi:carbonic anhydrase